jgi:hypothetical protein
LQYEEEEKEKERSETRKDDPLSRWKEGGQINPSKSGIEFV